MTSKHVTIQDYQGIVLVAITKNRLTDAADILEVGKDLMYLLDCHPRISLILDLSRVEAMSSQMLAKLVALHKGVVGGKGRMSLTGLTKAVMEVFKVTRLHKVFRFDADAQSVIMEYKRKPL